MPRQDVAVQKMCVTNFVGRQLLQERYSIQHILAKNRDGDDDDDEEEEDDEDEDDTNIINIQWFSDMIMTFVYFCGGHDDDSPGGVGGSGGGGGGRGGDRGGGGGRGGGGVALELVTNTQK